MSTTRPSKQNKKQTTKESIDRKLTSASAVNFLNNYQTNYNIPDNDQKLTFRSVTPKVENNILKTDKRNKVNVIDIIEPEYLKNFNKLCAQKLKEHKDEKLSHIEMLDITKQIYEPKLRGLLEIASNATIKPPKDEEEEKLKRASRKKDKDDNTPPAPRAKPAPKENAFEKFVIPSLHLGTPKEKSIETYCDAVFSFFTNKDKLRTRVYNVTFPHALHNYEKPARGVNIIYLQHISKYHDQVLNAVITEKKEERDVLELIQQLFIADFSLDKSVDVDVNDIKLQLSNKLIIDNFISNPTTENGIVDSKWVNKLTSLKSGPKGKGIISTDVLLEKPAKEAIKSLLKELNIVRSFINILKEAKDFNENVRFEDCLEVYNMTLAEIEEFYQSHKPKTRTYETFVKFFIEAAIFLKHKFNYASPLKNFITDLHSKVAFKFSKDTRKELDEAISTEKLTEEGLTALTEKFKEEWTDVNSPKLYDVGKVDIYAKLGYLLPVALPKQYRVAVGISLVQYMLDQIELIKAKNNKKKEIVIYIRA